MDLYICILGITEGNIKAINLQIWDSAKFAEIPAIPKHKKQKGNYTRAIIIKLIKMVIMRKWLNQPEKKDTWYTGEWRQGGQCVSY